jgi:fido (protein-threonine AMPylation protein)
LTLPGFTSIHKRIFTGIFKFAGNIRDYEISKREWVLDGCSVRYEGPYDLKNLQKEKDFNYVGLSIDDVVAHISRFTSDIWQIHPFGEGNTRITVVFIIKYLRSLGFSVNNTMFEKHSWYFRNVLVRANY